MTQPEFKIIGIRIVFLDRDGVINKYPGDRDYVKSWDEFSFLPGAAEAIKKVNNAGFKTCVVSNQAGVSKGVFSKDSLDEMTVNMLNALKAEGAFIDRVLYCLHAGQENCRCRKPKTGMLEEAFRFFSSRGGTVDKDKCFFIGDSLVDVLTGKAAGVKTVLVLSGREKLENKPAWEVIPDYIAADLKEAADIILK